MFARLVVERAPFRATFFQLTQGGRTRGSGALALSGAHAAQWVLRPQAPLAAPPSLRIGWQPASLVFVANGAGPFTLAVGRDGAARAQTELAQVAPGFSVRELLALEQAVAGPLKQQLAAPDAASAAQAAGRRRAAGWGSCGARCCSASSFSVRWPGGWCGR